MAQVKNAIWFLLGVGMLLGIILLPLSIKRLESTEYGVEYDTVAKDVGSVEGEGLHVGPVGFRFVKFPAVFRTEQIDTTCISKDGLFVGVDVSTPSSLLMAGALCVLTSLVHADHPCR
jgi:hypothetical protein